MFSMGREKGALGTNVLIYLLTNLRLEVTEI